MTADLVFWDALQSWGPGVQRPTGGWEVMARQLVEITASAGYEVHAYRPAPAAFVHNVHYWDSRVEHPPMRAKCLVLGRNTPRPAGIQADRVLVAAVDDPRFETHQVSDATVVCLSEWQREMFVALGHPSTHVIPSMIDDWIYDLARLGVKKRQGSYVCVNAWNKGTDATLALWRDLSMVGELTVGSPYGAPPDALARCRRVGARWIGELGPRQVVQALAESEAVFRVCERPETFGVTDAIAEVVGTRVYGYFPNGFGATLEVLENSFTASDLPTFRRALERRDKHDSEFPWNTRRDLRASTIIRQWWQLMGLG